MFCLIDLRDPPDIFCVGVQILQLRLAAQQPSNLYLVMVRQQVPGRRPLIGSACFLQIRPQLGNLFHGGGCLAGILRRPPLNVPPCVPQRRQGICYRRLEVIFGPGPVIRCLVPIVVVQGLLRDLEGLGHFRHPHQLVAGGRFPLLVEELRPPGGQLLVHLVDVGPPALCGDVHPPEVALPEVVEVLNVRGVLLRDLQVSFPQIVPQILVLVVELPVYHHALVVCFVEHPVHGLLGYAPLLQILFRQLPGDPFQVLPPRHPGHIQLVSHPGDQPILRPVQIGLYPPGQGIKIALLGALGLVLIRRREGIVRRLRRGILVHAVPNVRITGWRSVGDVLDLLRGKDDDLAHVLHH